MRNWIDRMREVFAPLPKSPPLPPPLPPIDLAPSRSERQAMAYRALNEEGKRDLYTQFERMKMSRLEDD